MKKLALIGGGGHCHSCIDVIESTGQWKIEAIVDLPEKRGEKVLNYQINASDEDIPKLVEEGLYFLITLGQIKTASIRRKIFDNLKSLNAPLATIIAPTAHISPYTKIGEGTIILHQAIVNANTVVGKNCIINTKALLEHDVRIANHCHISTASVINGGVEIDEGTFIGSNAVTKEYIKIGKQAIVGAGSRVLKNIQDQELVI